MILVQNSGRDIRLTNHWFRALEPTISIHFWQQMTSRFKIVFILENPNKFKRIVLLNRQFYWLVCTIQTPTFRYLCGNREIEYIEYKIPNIFFLFEGLSCVHKSHRNEYVEYVLMLILFSTGCFHLYSCSVWFNFIMQNNGNHVSKRERTKKKTKIQIFIRITFNVFFYRWFEHQ